MRALRDIAAAHKLTVSQVAAEILDRGLKERAETAGLGLLGPAIADLLSAILTPEVSPGSVRIWQRRGPFDR